MASRLGGAARRRTLQARQLKRSPDAGTQTRVRSASYLL